jgi:hypothetical protein
MVLAVIAEHAHTDGTHSFPSQTLLAAESGMTDRQVRTVLRRLVASGELHIEPRDGTSSMYSVLLPGLTKTSGVGDGDVTETSAPPRKNLPAKSQKLPAHPGEKLPTNRPSNHQRTVREPSASEDAAAHARQADGTTKERSRSLDDVRALRDRFAILHGRWPTRAEEATL